MDSAIAPTSGTLRRRGLLFVLSSPSGAGKTTVSRMLLEADLHIRMSVSVTTRTMRPGEVDGTDYHFMDNARFEHMAGGGEFLEWAEVFGNHYGTPQAEISAGLEEGQDFLFDIDWQGAQQLSQRMRDDVVRVFLLPPSLAELRSRLTGRGTDSAEVIDARMARAQSEISHWDGYDYVVINDDIDACFQMVRQILDAERQRRTRQTGLIGFVSELMKPES
jgi:guanylate kinase